MKYVIHISGTRAALTLGTVSVVIALALATATSGGARVQKAVAETPIQNIPGLQQVDYSVLKGKTFGTIEVVPIETVFRIEKGFSDCVKRNGGKVTVAATGGDPSKAASAAASFNQQGVAGIFNAASSAPAMAKAIADANKAKRPFITAFSDSAPGTVTIGGLELAGAARIGQYLIDRLHGRGKVIILSADVNQGVRQRHAAMRALLKEYPAIKVVQDYNVNVARGLQDAQKVMTAALQANPDINAVFAVYGEPATGAAKAIQAKGSKAFVVAFDAGTSELSQLRDAKSPFVASIATDVYGSGKIACAVMARMLAGHPAPAANIYIDSAVVTKENVPARGFAKGGIPYVLYAGE